MFVFQKGERHEQIRSCRGAPLSVPAGRDAFRSGAGGRQGAGGAFLPLPARYAFGDGEHRPRYAVRGANPPLEEGDRRIAASAFRKRALSSRIQVLPPPQAASRAGLRGGVRLLEAQLFQEAERAADQIFRTFRSAPEGSCSNAGKRAAFGSAFRIRPLLRRRALCVRAARKKRWRQRRGCPR